MDQDNWFRPGKHLGWKKSDSASVRRATALRSRRGNLLKTGRALQQLANVTTDSATKSKAALDARYFFRLNRKQKQAKLAKRIR